MTFGFEPFGKDGKILYARCFDDVSYEESLAKVKKIVSKVFTDADYSNRSHPIYSIYILESDFDKLLDNFNSKMEGK